MSSKRCKYENQRYPRVLVAEDDRIARRLYRRMLENEGYEVVTVPDGQVALQRMKQGEPFDVVLTDIHMPCTDGLKLLKQIRHLGFDSSVVLITAGPSLQSAIHSVELKAFRYLTKPFQHQTLLDVVNEATLAARKKASQNGKKWEPHSQLNAALEQSWIYFEPIVDVLSAQSYAFQARLRSASRVLRSDEQIRRESQTLGLTKQVEAKIQARLIDAIVQQKPAGSVLLELSASALESKELYEPTAPLSIHADRLVLQLNEEAELEQLVDLNVHLERLRTLGFRIALAGVGTGHGDLTHLASLKPELVKVGRSLVEGIDSDRYAQAIISSLLQLTKKLGSQMVAEDVESNAERETLTRLGVAYLQGPLICEENSQLQSQ